jgi:hypothetical protein
MNGLLLTMLPLLYKWTLHNEIMQQDRKKEESSQRYIPEGSSLHSQHSNTSSPTQLSSGAGYGAHVRRLEKP